MRGDAFNGQRRGLARHVCMREAWQGRGWNGTGMADERLGRAEERPGISPEWQRRGTVRLHVRFS